MRAAASATSRSSAWRSSGCSSVLAALASGAGRAATRSSMRVHGEQRRRCNPVRAMRQGDTSPACTSGDVTPKLSSAECRAARRGRHAKPSAAAGPRRRLLRGDEAERLQVFADERAQMLQVVAPKQAARAIAAGERLGAHHVGKIGVGMRPDPAAGPRARPDRAADARTCPAFRAADSSARHLAPEDASSPARGRHRSSEVTGSKPYGWRPARMHGKRPRRAHVRQKVIARPRESFDGQARAVRRRSYW